MTKTPAIVLNDLTIIKTFNPLADTDSRLNQRLDNVEKDWENLAAQEQEINQALAQFLSVGQEYEFTEFCSTTSDKLELTVDEKNNIFNPKRSEVPIIFSRGTYIGFNKINQKHRFWIYIGGNLMQTSVFLSSSKVWELITNTKTMVEIQTQKVTEEIPA